MKEFELFYKQTIKPLVAFLMEQGARLPEAADITQETMILAFQHWRDIKHPKAWAFRVAYRKFGRLRLDGRETPQDPLPLSPLVHRSDIEYWELCHNLAYAVQQLSRLQREVIAWSLAGYTPKEIAKEIGVSDDSVRQHLYRARKILGQLFTGKEPCQ